MSDIIERLRATGGKGQGGPLKAEAAAAIEDRDRTIQRLRDELASARAAADDETASLDERMKAAGMIPLSDLLAGNTPLSKWEAHTGVRDLASFEQWLLMKHSEYSRMRMAYELGDKDEKDELYEWVFAHAGAFGTVVANFRQALSSRAQEGR